MIQVGIITVSDSVFAGKGTDLSGPALEGRCQELGWDVIASAVLSDDEAAISQKIRDWADGGSALLILTTGGTGISARDNTPEATRGVIERELPGVSELMRSKGLEQTQLSVLSRGVTGTRKQTFIVNLPGSPAGALYSLSVIEALVPHVLKLLAGETEH